MCTYTILFLIYFINYIPNNIYYILYSINYIYIVYTIYIVFYNILLYFVLFIYYIYIYCIYYLYYAQYLICYTYSRFTMEIYHINIINIPYILLPYAIFFRVCLLGRSDFEQISKSVLRLLSTSRTKMRIRAAVQQKYACSVVGWKLRSSGGNEKKVYVNIIDNFYVIVHARRRRGGS